MADEYAAAVRAAEQRKLAADEEAAMSHEGGAADDMPPPVSPAQMAYDAALAAKGNEAENLKRYGTKERPADLGGPAEAADQKSFGTIRYPSYPQDATGERQTEEAPEEVSQASRAPAGPVMVPGGWQPSERAEQRKLGKPVPEEAQQDYRTAAMLNLGGAAVEHDASKELYAHTREMAEAKLAANKDAMVSRERLNADRDRFAKDKLAQIEDLNRQAQGNPEDLWSTPQALASVIGSVLPFLLVFAGGGLGAGLAGIGVRNVINSNINKDIEAKIEARKAAGHRADREKTIYDLHMDNFNDKGRAIEATRLAYYDNILQQMEAFKADHAGQISDARFAQATAGILKDKAETQNHIYLQGQDDVTLHGSERYRPAQVLGGAAGGRPEHLVTLSDGTTVQMGSEKDAQDARKNVFQYSQLIDLNQRIRSKRAEVKELTENGPRDMETYNKIRALSRQIKDEAETKIKLMSQSEDKSVVRESEHERAELIQSGGTRGLGLIAHGSPFGAWDRGVDSVLDNQDVRWLEAQRLAVRSGGGPVVEKGYSPNAMGQPVPTAVYTGQDVAPPQQFAPSSFKSMDRGLRTPTAPRPVKDITPRAPVWPRQPGNLSSAPTKRRHR